MAALFDRINQELKSAMKNREEQKLSVLRMMKSRVLYVNARGDLPEAEIIRIISKYGKELKEASEEFITRGRAAAAAQVEQELAIVKQYLPRELSPEELRKLIEQKIAETGAVSRQEMGKVIKAVKAQAPELEGKIVSELVMELLL